LCFEIILQTTCKLAVAVKLLLLLKEALDQPDISQPDLRRAETTFWMKDEDNTIIPVGLLRSR
jgi:hypothetical protein